MFDLDIAIAIALSMGVVWTGSPQSGSIWGPVPDTVCGPQIVDPQRRQFPARGDEKVPHAGRTMHPYQLMTGFGQAVSISVEPLSVWSGPTSSVVE